MTVIDEQRTEVPTDAQLLARVRDGDHRALRALFDRHAGAVHGYARGRVGIDGADDVVSETFTVAWRASDRFDPAAPSARPWLYGIATRVIARHREREQRWIQQQARRTDDRGSVDPPTPFEIDPSLARAIASLSPALRDVLLLAALGELSIADTARALRISAPTARVRLLRARRQVRASLEETDHG